MTKKTDKSTDLNIVKSPYYYLSKYRSVLMGLAIIWVVWFHSSVKIDFLPIGNSAFKVLKQIGYGGVDVFLLISGMGIYHSLEKNSISQYIKNRVKKIIPVWWGYLLIYLVIAQFILHVSMTLSEIIGFTTFTGFWLDMKNQGNWYLYAIMLFYLISPVIHSLLKNSNKKLAMCIVLVIISLIISVAFFNERKLMAFSRVPIYIMGMYVSASLKDCKIKKWHWIGLTAALIIGLTILIICYTKYHDYLRSYGLWWYPFIIIAPSLSLLTAKFFDIFQKILRPLSFLLSIFGRSSLEILLVSDFFFANFKKLNIYTINDRITAIFVVFISLVIGIAFHFCVDFITKQISKIKTNKA